MNKLLLFTVLAFISCLGLNAQINPPDAFVYQGLAKNPGTGGIATNTNIRLKVQVLRGGIKGTVVFAENHNTTTNADGIFSILVGRGDLLAGSIYNSIYDVPWLQDSFYFSLSISVAMKFPPNRYSPYLPIGTQQFFSVPYAMFAKEAQHVLDSISVNAAGQYRYIQLGQQNPIAFSIADNDSSLLNELQELVSLGGRLGLQNADGSISYTVRLPDSSSTNELQTISQNGNTITLSQNGGSVTIVDLDKQTLSLNGPNLSITNGNSVTLPDASDINEIQYLNISGQTLSITQGNSIQLNPNDADADPNNEIQKISKSGTTIQLSRNGGSVTDSDNQTLSLSGASLSVSSGNSVILPDGSSTNELQALGQTSGKGTITLSQGGGLVTLPDSSSSNEIQTISKSGSTISLSQSGGSVTDSDNQNLTLNGASLSISSGNTVSLPDASSSNEIQTLSITGNTISLSQSGGSVTVPDSDDQTLTLNGNTLSISSGNSVTINPNDADSDSTNEIQYLKVESDSLYISSANAIDLAEIQKIRFLDPDRDSLLLSNLNTGETFINAKTGKLNVVMPKRVVCYDTLTFFDSINNSLPSTKFGINYQRDTVNKCKSTYSYLTTCYTNNSWGTSSYQCTKYSYNSYSVDQQIPIKDSIIVTLKITKGRVLGIETLADTQSGWVSYIGPNGHNPYVLRHYFDSDSIFYNGASFSYEGKMMNQYSYPKLLNSNKFNHLLLTSDSTFLIRNCDRKSYSNSSASLAISHDNHNESDSFINPVFYKNSSVNIKSENCSNVEYISSNNSNSSFPFCLRLKVEYYDTSQKWFKEL